MALPARKSDPRTVNARRPHLKAVPSRRRREAIPAGEKERRKRCVPGGVARQNFRMLAVVVVVLTVLGLGRVWLSVQAAEASIDSYELRREIKAERYRGDMLEIQQSALSSPSRIRALAGVTMDMTAVDEVTVIDLPTTQGAPTVASRPRPVRPSGVERLLDDALRLAAGEAQVLLVGDVGLASTR